MTAIAALVAEAIQLARESTPPLVNECARVTYRGTDSAWAWYTRDDVRDAALTHLATRAAEAEGRAERAEREAAAFEALVMQAILGKGIDSIKTEDAPKLLARLIERGLEAEWEDVGEEAPRG